MIQLSFEDLFIKKQLLQNTQNEYIARAVNSLTNIE